jgi:hypothetical protein
MTIGIILFAAFALLFVRSSSLTRESERMRAELALAGDSLSRLSRMVDTLRGMTPGLGEYMSTIQLHAAKLWFAAKASNWGLAKYETDELDETMGAAEMLHTMKDSVDISHVLEAVRTSQLQSLMGAIQRKDKLLFRDAYDQMLAACNGCHRPAGFRFIHVITPTREPVTNQQW